jgi:hypothetical protein
MTTERIRTITFPNGATRTETTKAAKVMTHAVVCLENLEHRAASYAAEEARLEGYWTPEEIDSLRARHAKALAEKTAQPWSYMSQHTSRELAEKAMASNVGSANVYWTEMAIVEVTEEAI